MFSNYNPIDDIEKYELNNIKDEFLEAWLKNKKSEIDLKVKNEVTRVEMENLADAEKDWRRSSKISDISQPNYTQFHGKWVKNSLINSLEADKTKIELTFTEEAIKEFDNHWKANLEQIFKAQIKKLDVEGVKKQLFQRHPWLDITRHRITPYVESFLKTYLSTNMLVLQKQPRIIPWKSANLNSLLHPNFSWNNVNQEHLKKEIEGHPVANVQADYRGHYNYSSAMAYPSTANELTNHSNNLYISKLTRVDIFRFLDTVAHSQMVSKHSKDNIKCVEYAPCHIDELNNYSPEQLEIYKMFFVNIGTENLPLWIGVHKFNGGWMVYVPEDHDLSSEERNKLSTVFKPMIIQAVSFKENDKLDKLNDIKMTDSSKWNAILLGRIFPWCKQKDVAFDNEYRKKVPLSLLLHDVVSNCVKDNPNANSDVYKFTKVAFRDRAPFSADTAKDIFNSSGKSSNYLLGQMASRLDFIESDKLINNFDSGQIKVSDDFSTITVEAGDKLNNALYVVYHSDCITRMNVSNIPADQMTKKLFEYDVNLLSIQPDLSEFQKYPDQFIYATECAARNRFLNEVNSKKLDEARVSIRDRHELWNNTGNEILLFIKENGNKIHLDNVNEVVEFNNNWKKTNCDHEQRLGASPLNWGYAQIAQMGTVGLDFLFNELIKYKARDRDDEDANPNLDFTFDLAGNIAEGSEKYIRSLANHLNYFSNNSNECAPLFKSLGFILPDKLTPSNQTALIQLMQELMIRALHYPQEVNEIKFYNINIADKAAEEFIGKLESWANSGMQLQIKIPEWDRAAYDDKNQQNLKVRYRQLQNKIADNQRKSEYVKLQRNTKNIYLSAKNELTPELVISEQKEQQKQPWPKEDTIYPLTSQAPGVQQQLQQEMAQQVLMQQEQAKEKEYEEEQQQEIARFNGNESDLITRDNIQHKCKEIWGLAVAKNQFPDSLVKQNLRDLFSLWVGSDVDAFQVITKIEPQAMQKIMEYASHFRMGIAKDNLPPGFYLAQSIHNTDLILCFDKKREKEDLRNRNQQDIEKRNPFTLELIPKLADKDFRGDYQQFVTYEGQKDELQTFWQFLAREEEDAKRDANAEQLLFSKANSTFTGLTSAVIQRFDREQAIKAPNDLATCVDSLVKWAQNKHFTTEMAKTLFEDKDEVITRKNLKAFGQVFNHYDVVNKKENGSDHFLYIAEQMYENFGPEYFAVWKKRFLNESVNWSEYLDKKEVDAMALSITTLKGHPEQMEIWWKLVDTHGKALGHIRYADLWHSFQQVMVLLNQKKLILNKDALFRLLSTDNFNGQVFLDRLFYVLRHSRPERELQQDILNNIDKIDWRHNGYYYACRFEGYSYWNKNLLLSEFKPTTLETNNSYSVNWDNQHVNDPIPHALRYASQKLRFDNDDIERLNKVLLQCKMGEKDKSIVRLLIACLGVGMDYLPTLDITDIANTVDMLRQQKDPALIEWLNKQILLDKDVQNGSLTLRFADIPVLLQKIQEENKLQDNVYKLKLPASLEFINGAGRAIQCFKNESTDYVKELLNVAVQYLTLDSPLVTTYPWLIKQKELVIKKDPLTESFSKLRSTAVLPELFLFQKQLQSIDFATNKKLPDHEFLLEAFSNIAKADNLLSASRIRSQLVEQLINDGCAITLQGTVFRKLEVNETKDPIAKMKARLNVNFKDQNLLLCTKLFNECIAVRTDVDLQPQLDKLLNILIRIDNKPYYNELGHVLGTLISAARQNKKTSLYSITQLTTWLETLLNESTYQLQQYPVNLLWEIINRSPEQGTGLLNRDLRKLTERPESEELQDAITSISKSSLSNQFKSILVKVAAQNPKTHDLAFVTDAKTALLKLQLNLPSNKISSPLMDAVGLFIEKFSTSRANRSQLLQMLTLSVQDYFGHSSVDPAIADLWETSQVKLINSLIPTNNININVIPIRQIKDIYIQIIIAHAKFKTTAPAHLQSILNGVAPDQLKQLALYYANEPNPSAELLADLATKYKDTNKIIHEFEAVYQGLDHLGKEKRNYSLSEDDQESLKRVLGGFKFKGKGFIEDKDQKYLINLLNYSNSYSQVSRLHLLEANALQAQMHAALDDVNNKFISGEQRDQAAARLLACMREILLRKTGKWANHTQMLDLLYAAIYNDESLLHQVRTGQGKSIITLMRSSYLALNGYVVDVFSAKESLSRRDHEEFTAVFDAMGIANAYITDSSKAEDYKTKSARPGVGAVNYATTGNWSLYHSAHLWKGDNKVNLSPFKRVAWLDECDHILKFEKTQFNYSASADGTMPIYNMDEWAYRIVYDYYKELWDHAKLKITESGAYAISRREHLPELVKRLQEHAKHSPVQSNFMQKYIIPALSEKPEDMKHRDQYLKLLLTAAHSARSMEEGRQYCVKHDYRRVTDGAIIRTRFAKVVIDNQISPGSTYSDLVQQFLHVRLNKDAAEKGEAPDFFVDPYTQIALSQNAPYILKHYYSKLEGCSGTLGNVQDLAEFVATYKIERVVKLPTHERLGVKFNETLYCDSEEDQVDALVAKILNNEEMPILITCKDDIAVKRLAEKIKLKLTGTDFDLENKFIVDTNDSGKAESDIVPLSGKKKVVTISSRMGRGTDIKPESTEGLMVLRTYPAPTNVVKQEHGRGGRNGAKAICQDILNFKEILDEYKKYQKTPELKKRLDDIYEQQKEHLEKKLKKHENLKPNKFDWLKDATDTQYKYLLTRSIVQLNEEQSEEKEKYLRRKEYLIATLSGNVMKALDIYIQNKDWAMHKKLCDQWFDRRKQIDDIWNERLNNEANDSDKIYDRFFRQVEESWQLLARSFQPHLDRNCMQSLAVVKPKPKAPDQLPDVDIIKQQEDMGVVINFYQKWVGGAELKFFPKTKTTDPAVIKAIYGENNQYLSRLYSELFKLSTHFNSKVREKIFKRLTMHLLSGALYHVSCASMAAIMHELRYCTEKEIDERLNVLDTFFKNKTFTAKKEVTDVNEIIRNGKLLQLTLDVARTKYIDEDQATCKFVENMANAAREYQWNKIEGAFDDLQKTFGSKPKITDLLTVCANNKIDLGYLMGLIDRNRSHPKGVQAQKELFDYLQTHVDSLKNTPKFIRPIFAIKLSESYDDTVTNYLPPPDSCLPNLNQDRRSAFWYFLSQRLPLDEGPCTRLIDKLSGPKSSANFVDNVIQPLVKIPPYVSVDYIDKNISLRPGDHHFDDCARMLGSITEAAEHFNQFLFKNKIISNTNEYETPLDKFMFKTYVDVFESMSVTDAIEFFERATKISDRINKMQDGDIKNGIIKQFQTLIVGKVKDDKVYGNFIKCIKKAEHLEAKINIVSDPALKSILAPQATTVIEGFNVTAIDYFDKCVDKSDNLFKKISLLKNSNLRKNLLAQAVLATKTFSDYRLDLLHQYVEKVERLSDKINSFNELEYRNVLTTRAEKVTVTYDESHSHLDDYVQLVEKIAHIRKQMKLLPEDLPSLFKFDQVIKNVDHEHLNYIEMRVQEITQLTSMLKLMPNSMLKQFIMKGLKEMISGANYVNPTLAELTAFTELMKNETDLRVDEIQYLFQEWRQSNFGKDDLEIIKNIRIFEINHPELIAKLKATGQDIRASYIATPKGAKINNFFNEFLNVVNDPKNRGIEGAIFDLELLPIYNGYFDRTIKNGGELQQAFDVLKEAKTLQVKKNYDDYFSDFHCPKAKNRPQLMQFLYHEYVDVGEDAKNEKFSERCFQEYTRLAKRVIEEVPTKLYSNDNAGRSKLRDCFQQIIGLSREIATAAQHPFAAANAKIKAPNFVANINKDVAYFESQRKSYDRWYWYKNKVRKEQALSLFDKLDNLAKNNLQNPYGTKEDYYRACFTAIWNTQQEILKSDKNTKRNTKGYSRLYDISMQMFATLARDLLQDNDIALQVKAELTTQLQEQLVYHINLLHERLPENKLKTKMANVKNELPTDPWLPGSTELIRLNEMLKNKENAKLIPKELRYLVSNLDSLIQVADTMKDQGLQQRRSINE